MLWIRNPADIVPGEPLSPLSRAVGDGRLAEPAGQRRAVAPARGGGGLHQRRHHAVPASRPGRRVALRRRDEPPGGRGLRRLRRGALRPARAAGPDRAGQPGADGSSRWGWRRRRPATGGGSRDAHPHRRPGARLHAPHGDHGHRQRGDRLARVGQRGDDGGGGRTGARAGRRRRGAGRRGGALDAQRRGVAQRAGGDRPALPGGGGAGRRGHPGVGRYVAGGGRAGGGRGGGARRQRRVGRQRRRDGAGGGRDGRAAGRDAHAGPAQAAPPGRPALRRRRAGGAGVPGRPGRGADVAGGVGHLARPGLRVRQAGRRQRAHAARHAGAARAGAAGAGLGRRARASWPSCWASPKLPSAAVQSVATGWPRRRWPSTRWRPGWGCTSCASTTSPRRRTPCASSMPCGRSRGRGQGWRGVGAKRADLLDAAGSTWDRLRLVLPPPPTARATGASTRECHRG